MESSNGNLLNDGGGDYSPSKPLNLSNRSYYDGNDKHSSSINENMKLKKLLQQHETTIKELKTEVKQKTASLQVKSSGSKKYALQN